MNTTEEVRCYRSYGRVQGVGYRQFVLQTAQHLKLSGTVRNLSDGTVETWVRVPEAVRGEFENALREGPLLGEVADLKCVWNASLSELPEGKLPEGVTIDEDTFKVIG